MSEFNSLTELAEYLRDSNKKATLLYAFNATGKTRLSMEFKNLVNEEEEDKVVKRVIYYNAFTEDLFSWDNDLANDVERQLKMNLDSNFTTLIRNQGKEVEISNRFKEFSASRIEPLIDISTGIITFSLPTGDDSSINNIKISKGEESIFILSVFYVLIESIINELNIDDISDRSTDEFNDIKYIFIDDPITSLDDNHTIEVAIALKELISSSKNDDLRFIVSTHHALFYNVLYNEIKRDKEIKKKEYLILRKKEQSNEKYLLDTQNDSPFGYHLVVREEIKNAITENRIEKYHYSLFRNLLEKTSTYLGYTEWEGLLVGDGITDDNRQSYARRINFYSHNQHSELDAKDLTEQEKQMLIVLFENFTREFKWNVEANDGK